MKNAHHTFPEPRATSSHCFLCPIKNQKPNDFSCTIINAKEMLQMLTFRKLELAKIVVNWLSFDQLVTPLFFKLQVTYSLGPLLTYNLDLTKDPRSFGGSITTGSVFAIDSKTGWITTVSQMDHETCSSYSFEVVASDLGEFQSLSSTTVVTITVSDVNDNPPRFERELYRGAVKESDPLGEVVAVLKTRDQDGTDQNRLVSFYITGEEMKKAPTQCRSSHSALQQLSRRGFVAYKLFTDLMNGLLLLKVKLRISLNSNVKRLIFFFFFYVSFSFWYYKVCILKQNISGEGWETCVFTF